jgi:hypothetical protein
MLAVHDNGPTLEAASRDWPMAPALACVRVPSGDGRTEPALMIWREDAAGEAGYLHFPRSGFPPLKNGEDTFVAFSPAWSSAACSGCEPRLSPTMRSLTVDVAASSHRTGCLDCPEHGEYRLTATGQFTRVPARTLTAEHVLRCAGVLSTFTVRGDELVRIVEDAATDPAPELRRRAKPSHPYCTATWRYRGELWVSRACPASYGLRDLVTDVALSCCDRPPAPAPSGPGPAPWVPDCETIAPDDA